MGWINDLYQTYDNNAGQVGVFTIGNNSKAYTLLPIGHTTQNAQIEVTVDMDGNFYDAKVVEANDATTVIPCTEASISRTSSPVPHPLHDKLVYVAKNFSEVADSKHGDQPYLAYIDQLRSWNNLSSTNPHIEAVLNYLERGTLINDLVKYSILVMDDNERLLSKWTKNHTEKYGEKPRIFHVLSDSQEKAFVRFNTHEPGKINKRLWERTEIYYDFINFYKNQLQDQGLCYATGQLKPTASKHPSNIRFPGDSAKLISSNDTSGYTYRGRFNESEHVAGVSYEVSQKAHNALKWLILKQGKTEDGRTFLVWGNAGSKEDTKVPSPQDDALSLFESIGMDNKFDEKDEGTHDIYAKEIYKAIDGYRANLSYAAKVNIMVLDAATKGRLAVMYYQNLDKDEYLDRLKKWHSSCTWIHRYRKNSENKFIVFEGAPSLIDIAFSAYGPNASSKVKKMTMERMLPCVVDHQKIPWDLLNASYHRASRPQSMKKWEWEKTLSITCALYNKNYEKEGYSVGLDINNNSRDYLFGRLLAVADVLERNALGREEGRASNALRYMNTFSQHPARTWKIIQQNLQPYQAKMGSKAFYHNKLIDEIASRISINDFNDKPLSGLYLLGYYSQRHDLYQSKKDNSKNTEIKEDM